MKSRLILSLFLAGFFLMVLTTIPLRVTTADNPEEVPDVIAAVESGAAELLFAEISQEVEPSINQAAIYAELKELVKKYRKSREREAKERIAVRVEELMEQLFNAKVQRERHLVAELEQRLEKAKQRLSQLQDHKGDLVHKGVQKILESGEMPDWAEEDK